MNRLVILPMSNDSVIVMQVNLAELLQLAGKDVVLVTSTPPTSMKPGEAFRYQVVANSKHEKLTYRVASGPEGLSIDKDGLVTWKAPASKTRSEHSVILAIGGAVIQDVFHSFSLEVAGTDPPADAADADAADAAAAPPAAVTTSSSEPPLPDDTPAPADPRPATTPPPSEPATKQPLRELRIWTDDSGQFQVRAVLSQILDGKVRLRRPDGTEIQVEIARLGAADREYLQKLEDGQNNADEPPQP